MGKPRSAVERAKNVFRMSAGGSNEKPARGRREKAASKGG